VARPSRQAARSRGECANRPANHCTPTFLAEQARKLGKEYGLKVSVLERKDCEKLGMGSFLAVAQGSEQPPKFIVAHWQGGAKNEAPVVLVGKGITFDTGGISIKPAPEMDEMKFDMCGAASVLGTVFMPLAELKAKAINLIGLIPACENMPGRACRQARRCGHQHEPADHRDPEHRCRRAPDSLCDALTYAERFQACAWWWTSPP
jgi:leucyl aminopeptidase